MLRFLGVRHPLPGTLEFHQIRPLSGYCSVPTQASTWSPEIWSPARLQEALPSRYSVLAHSQHGPARLEIAFPLREGFSPLLLQVCDF